MATLLHEELTGKILSTCFEVSNELGAGFLESVYQNALTQALRFRGFQVEREYPISVFFRGVNVGEFFADILVEKKVLLELKAVSRLTDAHKAQVINYLKASKIDVGFLINFGVSKLEYRRFDNRFNKGIEESTPFPLSR
jgi:GxxExxY protein